jgi:hypothetical protein
MVKNRPGVHNAQRPAGKSAGRRSERLTVFIDIEDNHCIRQALPNGDTRSE